MSICLNPQCPQPQNPENVKFCNSCGSELLLQGRYRVIRPMGKGGFGQTYEVSDSGTRKVLKVLYVDDPKAISLFQQEAKVLNLLNHPGIPKADGYFNFLPRGNQEPLHCLVMEFIEGEDLKQWMQKRGNQPIDQHLAIQWLTQAVTILHQVHQQQFFHRDIKPSNIMLKPNGQLVLIDFGSAREVSQTYLAKVRGGQLVTGIISTGYTPPEQAIGKAVPQSDFFALGRTFVYLLTGKEPKDFGEDSRTGQLMWRDSAPQISQSLGDFIDELMALMPANRPQSTASALQQLAKIDKNSLTVPGTNFGGNGHSSAATIPVSPGATLAPAKNRGIEKWIAGAIVLVLTAVGFQIFRFWQPSVPVTQAPSTPVPAKPTPKPAAQPTQTVPVNPAPTPAATPPASPTPQSTETPAPDREKPSPSQTGEQPVTPPSATPKPAPASSQPATSASDNFVLANTLAAHEEPIYSLALSSNGQIVASGSADKTVKLWNLNTGQALSTLDRHGSYVWSVAISPDSKTLASGSADNQIMIWDVNTGQLQQTLAGHSDQVRTVAFSPDGKNLASGAGGFFKTDNTVKIWDVKTGQLKNTLIGHTDRVESIAISPDAKTLASGSWDNTIKIWDLNTGTELRTLYGNFSYVASVAFSPDGQTLVNSTSRQINLWNLSTGEEIRTLTGHQGAVNTVAISPNGKLIASGSDDRTIKLWDFTTGQELRTLEGHEDAIRSVVFSSDGKTLVSAGKNGEIEVWRVQ